MGIFKKQWWWKLVLCKGVVVGVMNKKNEVKIKLDEEYHRIGEWETETIEEINIIALGYSFSYGTNL